MQLQALLRSCIRRAKAIADSKGFELQSASNPFSVLAEFILFYFIYSACTEKGFEALRWIAELLAQSALVQSCSDWAVRDPWNISVRDISQTPAVPTCGHYPLRLADKSFIWTKKPSPHNYPKEDDEHNSESRFVFSILTLIGCIFTFLLVKVMWFGRLGWQQPNCTNNKEKQKRKNE